MTSIPTSIPAETASVSALRFDASLRALWKESDEGWVLDMPSGWMQGRSVYGGLVAAVAGGLARLHIEEERTLRLSQMQLMRPLVPGPVVGRVNVQREGKYASFVSVELVQDSQVATTASYVFARPRPGSTPVAADPAWAGPDPETLRDLPYIPGVMPEFVKNVQMRWASGALPYSQTEPCNFRAYCAFRSPSGGLEGVLGLLDIFPAPSLAKLSGPVPASTVAWTAHILNPPDRIEGWCRFEYETVLGVGGMHTVVGRLHAEDGTLLGWTEQLVAV
ncbi:MAG: acyl-CoA thioesterase, partial [Bradymonadia bacterium]